LSPMAHNRKYKVGFILIKDFPLLLIIVIKKIFHLI
jgi:hypothetical protein